MIMRLSQIVYVALVYFVASIPFSFLVAKALTNTDIREFGDGNPGAYNAWRYASKPAGYIGFTLDFLKGSLPIVIVKKLWPQSELMLFFTAVSSVSGHAWSWYLHFHGGKCLAVSAGVLLTLLDKYMPLFWACVLGALRFLGVSPGGSVLITLCTANVHTYFAVTSWYLRLTVLCISLIVLYKHKDVLFPNRSEAYMDV